jgi:hypothetical protein
MAKTKPFTKLDTITLDVYKIEFHPSNQGTGDSVWLIRPETRINRPGYEGIGWVKKVGPESWTAVSVDRKRWNDCVDRITAVRHLVGEIETREQLRRQREKNRGPNAMFKTTLVMWSTKKPKLGTKSSDSEIVEHICHDLQAELVIGPNTEVVEDPSADPEYEGEFIPTKKRRSRKKAS